MTIFMYGLVHFHQNTNHFLVEFPATKDTKASNNINNSFWSALVSSVILPMSNSYQSYVLVLFSNMMDGSGTSFLPLESLCKLMASNKSSNNTVMRESVLVIVFLNGLSMELAISILTASQNITCPFLVVG
jgi:hypothetical protein